MMQYFLRRILPDPQTIIGIPKVLHLTKHDLRTPNSERRWSNKRRNRQLGRREVSASQSVLPIVCGVHEEQMAVPVFISICLRAAVDQESKGQIESSLDPRSWR